MKNNTCIIYFVLGVAVGAMMFPAVKMCLSAVGKSGCMHNDSAGFDQEISSFTIKEGMEFNDVIGSLFASQNQFVSFEVDETVAKHKFSGLSVTGISFRQLLQLLCADANCECLYSPIRRSLVFAGKDIRGE